MLKIKNNSVKLVEIYCLPQCLYEEIVKTGYDSSESRVKILMNLSQRFLRNKGYYKLGYPFVKADIQECYRLCKGLPL